VLIQHLDPDHKSALTQLLNRISPVPVCEVSENMAVEPDHVYVIQPNTNLGIDHGVLKIHSRPTGRAPHLSVDFFLKSLAHDQRDCAIGVILSGTASDGTQGMEAIKAEGGITFAQDKSAKYELDAAQCDRRRRVDFVLAPAEIAKELTRLAKHPYLTKAALARAKAHPEETLAAATKPAAKATAFKKSCCSCAIHSGVGLLASSIASTMRRWMQRSHGVGFRRESQPDDCARAAGFFEAVAFAAGFRRRREGFFGMPLSREPGRLWSGRDVWQGASVLLAISAGARNKIDAAGGDRIGAASSRIGRFVLGEGDAALGLMASMPCVPSEAVPERITPMGHSHADRGP